MEPHPSFVVLMLLYLSPVAQAVETALEIPKCCEEGSYFVGNKCTLVDEDVDYSYYVYESNATHIESTSRRMSGLAVRYSNFTCQTPLIRVALTDEDIIGIIYNSTALCIRCCDNHIMYLSPDRYCMEYKRTNSNETKTVFLYCYQELPNVAITVGPKLYIIFLFISTVCFFASALIYYLILGADDNKKEPRKVHKKCFLGYALSMGTTFLFLIVLQKVNYICSVIGSLFFVFALSSFVWLTCLCIDLIVLVRNFKKDACGNRLIYLYSFFSTVIPSIILLISTLVNDEPAMPNTFIKGHWEEDVCKFKETSHLIFFVPILVMLFLGFCCVVYTIHLTRKFNKKYENNYDWVRKKQHLRHMLNSNGFLITISFIWILNAMLGKVIALANQIPFDMLESLQGIFTLFIFVLNKHTRKKVIRTCGDRERSASERMEEQELNYIQRNTNGVEGRFD
ncbi:unnamed protein product [Acanthoscelides obtectus]|uniref:G-protein coupled receptors family 2 profile 2 domain-containing protein n=1 Tax=Acanthoscelides obtectus TaxID=200917 RepID=A0A9P0JR86_ACAOB|nr:unnamed protein product [Acanthoscelides obtectus]CAK1667953.1 G-protein coupled receptor Mth [Acanthoscelides obtectus]